jgi:hypothetical protein
MASVQPAAVVVYTANPEAVPVLIVVLLLGSAHRADGPAEQNARS